MLYTITVSTFKKKLHSILKTVSYDNTTYNIVSYHKPRHSLILLTEEEYCSLIETASLLANDTNLQHLKTSINQATSNNFLQEEE